MSTLTKLEADNLYLGTVTIANGAATSDALATNGLTPVAVIMPAAWTAASLSFTASVDGTNFFTHTAPALTVAASQMVMIPATSRVIGTSIKLFSENGSGVGVNQLAERTLQVLFKKTLG